MIVFLFVGGCGKKGGRPLEKGVVEGGGGASALFRAIEQDDLAGVKAGADHVNSLHQGQTALHKAVERGAPHIVEELLKMNAPVDKEDGAGQTPLGLAHNLLQADPTNSDRKAISLLLSQSPRATFSPSGLHQAVEQGSLFEVKLQLKTHPSDLNALDSEGQTPLHYAARKGNKAIVAILIKEGAKLDIQDNLGQTALHRAVFFDNQSTLQQLIHAGADKTLRDKQGQTAFDLADSLGYQGLAALLKVVTTADLIASIKEGATERAQSFLGQLSLTALNTADSQGRTALYWAVAKENELIVNALIQAGVNVNTKDNTDQTALHQAVVSENVGILHSLLDAGADVNATNRLGQTALHKAAAAGNLSLVSSLLTAGADKTRQDQQGQTAASLAKASGHDALAKFLEGGDSGKVVTTADLIASIKEGDTPRAKILLAQLSRDALDDDDKHGKRPLHWACEKGLKEIVGLLLNAGVSLDRQDEVGKVALHYAVEGGYSSIVDLLLRHDARVDKSDDYGKEALHYASERGDVAIIQALLKKSADVNKEDETNKTPLHYASSQDNPSAVVVLLDRGASVNARDNLGDTPLHYAALLGNESTVKALVGRGADFTSVNKKGETPLDVAGDESVRTLLLNSQDRDGNTLLLKSIQTGSFERAQALI